MKTSNVRSILGLVCTFALLLAVSARADEPAKTLKAGDAAPVITGTTQNGAPWNLASVLGRKYVLLYFYPKDETPGCTKEACSLRDDLDDFRKNNVAVVGVSFDSPESHRAFIVNHHLSFTLLSDMDGKITDAYGARKAGKNMARRISFLIGLDGKIVHVTDSPNPDVHIREMKTAISELKKP